MAYADYMFYFETERPRRKRPYSQKSLRKFDHRRRAEDECTLRDWPEDFNEYTFGNRVKRMTSLSAVWRRLLTGSGKARAVFYFRCRIDGIMCYPPCPLPD